MPSNYNYRKYREIVGKVNLADDTAETIAKLVADGQTWHQFKDFFNITEDEYNKITEDKYFKVRVGWIKSQKTKAEIAPKSPDELIEYGISRLLYLSKAGKSEHKTQVDASKQLVSIGMELKTTLPNQPAITHTEKNALDSLNKAMGA